MRELGASSASELAETMRWPRGTERLVAKWLAGNNSPSYGRTMEMLERCGWISMSGGGPRSGEQASPPADPQERIAWLLTILARNQSLALDALGVPEADRLPVEPPAPPKRARPKRKPQ